MNSRLYYIYTDNLLKYKENKNYVLKNELYFNENCRCAFSVWFDSVIKLNGSVFLIQTKPLSWATTLFFRYHHHHTKIEYIYFGIKIEHVWVLDDYFNLLLFIWYDWQRTICWEKPRKTYNFIELVFIVIDLFP